MQMELDPQLYRYIIGLRLQQYCEKTGKDQVSIAKRVKYTLGGQVAFDGSKLSRILHGKQDISLIEAKALCNTIGCNLDDILPNEKDIMLLHNALCRVI